MQFGLKDIDLEMLVIVFRENPKIEKAVLFGSRAKGTYENGSDVDIALIGDNLKLDDVIKLSLSIDKLDLPYKFDLIIYQRIKELKLKEHIDRVGKEIYISGKNIV